MRFETRRATAADEPFLWQMLYEAAHLEEERQPFETVYQNPELLRYVENWGAPGDLGVVAIAPVAQPIAAAWLRLLTGDRKGYGYVNEETPELAIATVPAYRGQGAGTAALKSLIREAQGLYPAISLSARADNPAVRLYQRLGFQPIPGSEVVNRVAEQSFTMILRLNS